MRKCINCGMELQDEELFCGECGTKNDIAMEEQEGTDSHGKPEEAAEEGIAIEEAIVGETAIEEPIVGETAIEEPTLEEIAVEETAEETAAEETTAEGEDGSQEEMSPCDAADREETASCKADFEFEADRTEADRTESEETKPEKTKPEETKEKESQPDPGTPEVALPVEAVTETEESQSPVSPTNPSQTIPPAQVTEDFVFCPACGTQNGIQDTFCANCGTKLSDEIPTTVKEEFVKEESIFCHSCGTKNPSGDQFCQNCGVRLCENETQQEAKKKKGKLPLAIAGAAAVAVVALGVLGVSYLMKPKLSPESSLIYSKQNAVVWVNTDKMRPVELSGNLYKSRKQSELIDLFGSYRNFFLSAVYSRDGRYVFYMENIDSDYTGDLCYMDLKKQSEKRDTKTKLASGVTNFVMTDDGKVFYKDRKQNLYFHNLKDKEKIGTDVDSFSVSKDHNYVIWINSDEIMYCREMKTDSENIKLDTGVSKMVASDDLKTIYYEKNENIYCYTDLKEKAKIASDATLWRSLNDGKAIYYEKRPETELSALEIVEDDMAQADSQIKKPDKSDFETQVQTWYGTQLKVDYDAYDDALEQYDEKEKRDEIRSELKTYDVYDELGICDLYVYNGKESKLLVSNTADRIDLRNYQEEVETPDCLYLIVSIDAEKITKIKLSEISEVFEISGIMEEALFAADSGYLLASENSVPFTYDSNNTYVGDIKNKMIYVAEYDEEKAEYVKISSVKYSENSVDAPVDVAVDLDSGYIDSETALQGGKLYYYKEYDWDTESGTLYCDGAEIDQDVYFLHQEEGTLYYMKDGNEDHTSGTLMKYTGGKGVEVAEDVYIYKVLKNNNIAVLTDYDENRSEGTLSLIPQNGGKPKLVDDEVTDIFRGIQGI